MAEIRNLTRNGETFYPQTHAEGVLDPEGEYIGYYVDNPEWIKVIADHDGKILAGIKVDGSVEWSLGIPQPIKDYIQENIISDLTNKVDNEEGKSLINSEVASSFDYIESPEFLSVELDENEKVLGGRRIDGTKFENVGIETPNISVDGVKTNIINDLEGRLEIKTDSAQKIISNRKKDGTLVENAGIETNHLELTKQGMTDFQKALKDSGFRPGGAGDFSNEEFVEIPIPDVCAYVNLGVNSQAESKGLDIETFIEYYDKNGNYFKKPVVLNAQGDSSLQYWIKNQAIDITDGSTIKFGNLVPQDSFHIKKYYQDVFRGQCIVGYWLTEQVYKTRRYGERRPWDYLNQGGSTLNATGKFKKDFNTGALAHPDGFPVHVYFNGKDAGIYTFNLKKHRDNYYAKKDSAENIILDGKLGNTEIFGVGSSNIDWTAFEIRNPKSLKLVDGSKYDGDNPSEITGDSNVDALSASVKGYIERLADANRNIRNNKTKETFEQYFNVPFFIDYFLISQVIYHYDGFWKNWIWCSWDGNKWAPTSYDMDSIFGMLTDGTGVIPAGEYHPLKEYVPGATNTNSILGNSSVIVQLLLDLYEPEIKERYKNLRDGKIFSTDNIVDLLEKWVNAVGYDNLKNDIEKICAFEGVPQTPSYRDGSREYAKTPTTGGFYNSILRVKRWLVEHFAYLDSSYAFDYDQN